MVSNELSKYGTYVYNVFVPPLGFTNLPRVLCKHLVQYCSFLGGAQDHLVDTTGRVVFFVLQQHCYRAFIIDVEEACMPVDKERDIKFFSFPDFVFFALY